MTFTIIIPTYMRPNYLKRILQYYDSFKDEYHILVADSSQDKIKKINKTIISSFSNLNISYLNNYPPDLNPHHKFADAVVDIKNQYCVICADDDFIVPSGINAAVKFLEENKDFTCAHGNYIGFKLDPENKKFYWKNIYPYNSITCSDPKERLQCHLEQYYQTLYAVHRTDFFKMIYKELLISEVDPMQFGELLPDMLTLIYGKMKRLDTFYATRAIDSRVAYWPTLFEYMNQGKYETEYLKFKNCVAFHLSKNSNLDLGASRGAVDEGWKLYIKALRRNQNQLIHKLKNYLDYGIIKEIYRKLFRRNDYTKWTADDPPENYLDDFNKIKNIVLSTNLE